MNNSSTENMLKFKSDIMLYNELNESIKKLLIINCKKNNNIFIFIFHKQVPLLVPCVNFTQITEPPSGIKLSFRNIDAYVYYTYYCSLTSSVQFCSPSVMGGVCKIWLFIHRNVLLYDYLRFHLHVSELQKTIWTEVVF